MSRIIKQKYTAFQRHILKEFMTEKQLKELDTRYTIAKVERMFREARITYEKLKVDIKKLKTKI